MAFLILDYGTPRYLFANLSTLPMSAARLIEGRQPTGRVLADLGPDDELLMYSTRECIFARTSGLKCKLSLLVREPIEAQKTMYSLIPSRARIYHRIITHHLPFVEKLANAEHWFHGGTLIDIDAIGEPNKTKRMSIFASKKRKATGHKLRHKVIGWAKREGVDLDFFGSGYKPVDSKIEGHRDYCFSVVIENCRSRGYFSEQILDAILCGAVPIYWGDPDIAQYFDTDGMIVCNSFEDIKAAIKSFTVEDYASFQVPLQRNREAALRSLGDKKCMCFLEHPSWAQYNVAPDPGLVSG